MQNKNKIIIKSINIAIKTAKCQVGSVIAMLIDFLLLFSFYFACIIIATFVYACP